MCCTLSVSAPHASSAGVVVAVEEVTQEEEVEKEGAEKMGEDESCASKRDDNENIKAHAWRCSHTHSSCLCIVSTSNLSA